jgi:putative restriction endonuclease
MKVCTQVTDYWQTIGQAGFKIFQFRLCRSGADSALDIDTWHQAPRVTTTMQRIVRNTAVATKVKSLHANQCQVCGTRLQTSAGPYSEAAHIRALGAPHHGPDTVENILCLCPNHHVLFDNGGIYVDDNKTVRDGHTHVALGMLRMKQTHDIDAEHLKYHREHFLK